MVLVGFFCVLGAVGLLVVGLVQNDSELVWASIGASAIGGIAVAIASLQRGRELRGARADAAPPRERSVATAKVVDAGVAEEPAVHEPAKKHAAKEAIAAEPVGEAVAKEPVREPVAKQPVAEPVVALAASTPTADLDSAPDPEQSGPEAADPEDEPGEEDVDMADLLLVIDMSEEVLVVDLRPRYHLAGCAHLRSRTGIPLPVSEAREDGFTPCVLCKPDAALAATARAARANAGGRSSSARPRPGP